MTRATVRQRYLAGSVGSSPTLQTLGDSWRRAATAKPLRLCASDAPVRHQNHRNQPEITGLAFASESEISLAVCPLAVLSSL
jgi:hypothetical protein